MFEHHLAGPGDVQTVTGIRRSHELGVVLPFEHLLSDAGAAIDPPIEASARELYFSAICEEVLSNVRYYGGINQGILRLGNVAKMVDELNLLKQWGGGTVVDCTTAPLGRDPTGLAQLARRTEINIVMSTSYESVTWSNEKDAGNREDQALSKMVDEIREGVPGHGIRAGLINLDEARLLTTQPEDSAAALRASVVAHSVSGAPLMVRPARAPDSMLQAIDSLAELDISPGRVIIGRAGGRSIGELKRAAKDGFLLAFDSFGALGELANSGPCAEAVRRDWMADDDGEPGLETILELIEDGFERQVLLSHGIGRGDRLAAHGGHGYFYVSARVIPALKSYGVPDDTLQRLVSDNPQKALSFHQ